MKTKTAARTKGCKSLHLWCRSVAGVFFVSFYMCGLISIIDALDTLILRVKRRFEVCFGLVYYSHPLQGKLTTLYEVSANLMKKETVRENDKS